MYMLSASDLRSQALSPSNHLWRTFPLLAAPQFLNQAPPGAQQLTRPDFSNVPHFGHTVVLVIVGLMDSVLVRGALVMSSRSMVGGRDTYRRMTPGVGSDTQTVRDIDPGEPANMLAWRAWEWTQPMLQSFCMNDFA